MVSNDISEKSIIAYISAEYPDRTDIDFYDKNYYSYTKISMKSNTVYSARIPVYDDIREWIILNRDKRIDLLIS